ncbi:MAG: ribonuclease E/G [Clostridiales bacterium]|nr:ribonuclease E/G [Clostridiales bacterium]
MKELLIKTRGDQPALALMKDRRLLEYWPLTQDTKWASGAIYKGRVCRVMNSLNALFVTLAPGVEGFLPFLEVRSEQPRPGEAVLVQIKRPPQGKKAAYLTQDISLPGRYCMLLPYSDYAHASKRAAHRQAMKRRAQQLRPSCMGLVLRSKAELAQDAEIKAEIARLQSDWDELMQKESASSAPALLRPAPKVLDQLLMDEEELPSRVITDDESAAKGLPFPSVIHSDPFSLYNVLTQLKQALRRRVYLPSGGLMVLDPTEAALVIDVNTAKDSKRAGDLLLRTNLEAAAEIARLLRLRRAGGIILIDFIDMDTDAQREQVQKALEMELAQDRVKTEILGFTRLGLMEMTRKRADAPLPAERLCKEETTADDA